MASRDFSPKLTAAARRAITEAFDAMSTSSSEMAASSERVIEKLARVAQELGWPDSVVRDISEAIRNTTKMQTDMIARIMDACEAQVSSPNPMARVPSEMMAYMRSWPNLFSSGGWSRNQAFGELTSNPVQFWIHVGEQWQKNWVQMMAPWVDSGFSANSLRRGGH
jgi:hypothetical protein